MLICKSKRPHFFTKFELAKNDMKQTWRTINNVIGKCQKQSSYSKFKDECDNVFTNPQDISNKLNEFFVNIGPELAANIHNTGKNYYDYLKDVIPSSMYFKPILEMDIMKIINSLIQVKVPVMIISGILLLKRVANEIVKPLTMIFNLSISTGIVPEMLKIAKVVPIYKKDDAEKFSNYRPVSLLPCFF